MHLIPYENLPLSFESGGYISRKYSGRLVTKLTNYSVNSVKLSSGTPVGYIQGSRKWAPWAPLVTDKLHFDGQFWSEITYILAEMASKGVL